MSDHCRGCRYRKLGRKLNQSQELRLMMAKALRTSHELSRRKKYEMMEEIVREFCRIGQVNVDGECKFFELSWWRRMLGRERPSA